MEDFRDYKLAKRLGFTDLDRWSLGRPHHRLSQRLMDFLVKHDFNDYGNHFGWSTGGDGDNGETLMYEMDAFFELVFPEDIVNFGNDIVNLRDAKRLKN